MSAVASSPVATPASNNFPSNLLDAADAACSVMEVDPPPASQEETDSDGSSTDVSDSSDTEDSSETDEETSIKNGAANQLDLSDLEKLFYHNREWYYQERIISTDSKLEQVRAGKAQEYLGPLKKLQENMSVRVEVAAKLRDYRIQNMHNKMEAEKLASKQDFENAKNLLRDRIQGELEDNIRRLEEDRNNDFSSDITFELFSNKRKSKKSIDPTSDKKKKPVQVSGPYVVYMIDEMDIMEDWSTIKKALAAPRRKVEQRAVGVF